MAFPTMGAITEKFVGQPYDLNSVLAPAQVWAKLDSPPEEVRVALNAVVSLLNAITDGTSGADSLGIPETIAGSGTNVRDRADWLYAQIVAAVLGAIPDGSLTTAKYANGSVTAAKCAADVATQAELDNLAGAGRTIETVKNNADTIANHSANTTTAHGAVSAATASTIIVRDASGRAKVVGASAASDIAILSDVTGNVEDTPTAGHTTNAASSNSVATLLANYARYYKKDAGSTDAYVVVLSPAIVSYIEGMTLDIFCNTANTGAATLDAGGGAKDLRKYYNDALETGDIEAGAIITVKWDSANDWWQVTSGIKVAIVDASDTVKGIVELATDAEVTTGTSTTLAVTPAGAKVELDKRIKSASGTWSDTTTSIAASSNYTKNISVGFNATKGVLMIKSASSTGASCIFTTNVNEAASMGFGAGTTALYYGVDGQLCPGSGLGSDIILYSVRMNGGNLEIILRNTNGSTAKTISVANCTWEAFG